MWPVEQGGHASKLLLRLPPRLDETFTSWLIRLSAAHGLRIPAFCSLVADERIRLNRDVDGLCGLRLIEKVAGLTDLDKLKIRSDHSLLGFEGQLFPCVSSQGATRWILPTGKSSNQLQFMQFCPVCLDDEVPYYRRVWRLSLVATCSLHGVGLLNACASCGATVNPIKADALYRCGTKPLCWRCGGDLRHGKAASVEEADVSLTRRYEGILAGTARMQVGSTEVTTTDYFQALAPLCARLIRQKQRLSLWRKLAAEAAGVMLAEPIRRHSSAGFDALADPAQRRPVLRTADWLLEEWPERFLRVARDAGTRTSDFVMHFGWHPKWFVEPLQTLLTPVRRAPPPSEGIVRARRKRQLILSQRKNWCINRQDRIVRALRAAGFYSPDSPDKAIIRALRFSIAKLRAEGVGYRRRATLELPRNTPVWRELQRLARPYRKDRCSSAEEIQRGIRRLCQDVFLSSYDLSQLLGRCQQVVKAKHLTVMVRDGLLETRFGPTSSGYCNNPQQAYRSTNR